MTKYSLVGSRVTHAIDVCLVEIEADTLADAIEQAQAMERDGVLEWDFDRPFGADAALWQVRD